MNPIIMHINYAESSYETLGMSVLEAAQMAKRFGFDGVEYRGKLPNNYTKDRDTYLKEIADAKEKTGIEVMFGVPGTGTSNKDESERAKAVEGIIEFYRKAKEICGTTVCNAFSEFYPNPAAGENFNLTGSFCATEDDWKFGVDSYKQIGAACAEIGMKIAFETHMSYLHDTPKCARKLVDLIDSPAVGINMDYGNTAYFINMPSPADVAKLYGEKLYYMHLKNAVNIAGCRMPTSLAEGDINHRAYLKAIKEMGYTGPIGIEAPRGGDRVWFVRNDIGYFKALAEEIGL
ncbi:MAG: sugar phosphate isomerase/epimerase [Clostridia bacterium]|nr:sugar phosphate isomerase/epimerase [Clostridia bacterium]